MQATPLITTIVAGISLALLLGLLAHRLRISPLVGYLLAGVVVGPFTPGFVADQHLASELAEMGVILLMFGVGLHFSVKDLISVKWVVVPGALSQIFLSTLLGFGLGVLLGWPLPSSLVFGLAISVASTVVTLRGMQEHRLIETREGHLAVGWLVVQDLTMVLALVLLPVLAEISGPHASAEAVQGGGAMDSSIRWPAALGLTAAKLVAFAAVMLLVGRRLIPRLLHYVAHTGSRELFRLAVLSISLGVAYLSARLFGVSLALGAFLAGMILSESELSQQAAEESLPFRDAFAVLFFVSVGMLFNPLILWRAPLPVAAVLAIVLVGNTGVALLIQLALRQPLASALVVSASLGQIGEFSFILANLGIALGIVPQEGRDLVLAASILSIMVNPGLVAWARQLAPSLARRLRPAVEPIEERFPEARPISLSSLRNHTVLIGYGRVGKLVGEALAEARRPFLVVELHQELVEGLRERRIEVILGNAAAPEILKAANVAHADTLVVAIPNGFEAGQIVEQARAANPTIEIIARAHSDAEVAHLREHGADLAIMGEREIARGMIERLVPAEKFSPIPTATSA
jgi:monovalent cation:H+ antiporter-2, CPA2 family